MTELNACKAHQLLLEQGTPCDDSTELIGRVALLHCRNGTGKQCDQTLKALKDGHLVITYPINNGILTNVFSHK